MEYELRSPEALEAKALEFGLLPFFAGPIDGFSVEEHTPSNLWFADDVDGPWEWKGAVVRNWRCAYGKFFNGKAVYVSLDWLPHLINYRRSVCRLTVEERDVLQVITAHESLLTTDIRQLCGFANAKRKQDLLLEPVGVRRGRRPSLDTILTRLQMSTYIVVADFEYKTDKHGKPYGWGVARYVTPEALYADALEQPSCSAEESYNAIVEHLCRLFPSASRKVVEKYVK